MKDASKGVFKDILAYTEDEIVSSDIIGATAGSIFDATGTKVLNTEGGKQLVKLTAWYDNEYSYTCQYIRLAEHLAKVHGLK